MLSHLTPDERAFVAYARAQDWPRTGMLLAIIDRLHARLAEDEAALYEAKQACGARWQPGMSVAQAIVSIRAAR